MLPPRGTFHSTARTKSPTSTGRRSQPYSFGPGLQTITPSSQVQVVGPLRHLGDPAGEPVRGEVDEPLVDVRLGLGGVAERRRPLGEERLVEDLHRPHPGESVVVLVLPAEPGDREAVASAQ